MRALCTLLLILILPTPVSAQQELPPDAMFSQALLLHDAGDFDGAIAIYRQLLRKSPDNLQVKYELAFSLWSKGSMEEALSVASAGAEVKGPLQAAFLEIFGNSHDALGRSKEAIDAYKRALKLEPMNARIHLNLGIAYSGAGKARDSRREFERAADLDPTYASAHFALGETYRTGGYRIPAVFAYARYLSLDNSSPRAKEAAVKLLALLGAGVESKDGTNINITIDSESKKDLGDFSALEMMLALAGTARFVREEGSESQTEADIEAGILSSFAAMVSESGRELGRNFVTKTYLPFFTGLVREQHATTFAHVALSPLALKGSAEWLAAHAADVARFKEWANQKKK